MYVPDAFAVTDEAELAALLGASGLGCLVTHGPQGLYASHLPFVYDAGRQSLCGHLARANPHQQAMSDDQGLVIFQGANAYVSPNYYPSKAEEGRVVPTWNYEVLHVYGRVTWHESPVWLRDNVQRLTERFERDQASPWSVNDAPSDYVERLLGAIIGVQVQIERIEGKRKLSQNRGAADRSGVAAGLAQSSRPGDREVAEIMRERSSI